MIEIECLVPTEVRLHTVKFYARCKPTNLIEINNNISDYLNGVSTITIHEYCFMLQIEMATDYERNIVKEARRKMMPPIDLIKEEILINIRKSSNYNDCIENCKMQYKNQYNRDALCSIDTIIFDEIEDSIYTKYPTC